MKIVFRDLNHSGVVQAVQHLFPEWDAKAADIWDYAPHRIDAVVSPANCTGRMDGGIDQVLINRFGWQLEKRLMRDILAIHRGHLPIGHAHLITTYDLALPLMICAPTMEWPPHDVSGTQNAYLAFRAILRCAHHECLQALEHEPTILMSGLGTATGRMTGEACAVQMRRAWDEFFIESKQ